MRPALPRQQAAVLAAIRGSVDAFGFPPTIREIAEDIGVTSTATVVHHLRELEFKGYIRRDYARARAIEVLP